MLRKGKGNWVSLKEPWPSLLSTTQEPPCINGKLMFKQWSTEDGAGMHMTITYRMRVLEIHAHPAVFKLCTNRNDFGVCCEVRGSSQFFFLSFHLFFIIIGRTLGYKSGELNSCSGIVFNLLCHLRYFTLDFWGYSQWNRASQGISGIPWNSNIMQKLLVTFLASKISHMSLQQQLYYTEPWSREMKSFHTFKNHNSEKAS